VVSPHVSGTPGQCLAGAGSDEYVAPAGVESDIGDVVEDHIVGAGVEEAEPPWLVTGLVGQVPIQVNVSPSDIRYAVEMRTRPKRQ